MTWIVSYDSLPRTPLGGHETTPPHFRRQHLLVGGKYMTPRTATSAVKARTGKMPSFSERKKLISKGRCMAKGKSTEIGLSIAAIAILLEQQLRLIRTPIFQDHMLIHAEENIRMTSLKHSTSSLMPNRIFSSR
mmetsp:Transcript_29522/g.66469  ORF Transcript_29522/g.66469 Transcript_29522/m.66469 type:complete len:134 (+) Transcript_29522:15-416(+)